MDNLTHTLFAATLARTRLGRAGRGTTAALLLASNAPDIDVVSAAGGTMSYLHWHRGPTHGILGVFGLGALTAAIVWGAYRLIDRRRDAPSPAPAASFAMLTAISMLAVALHVLMDLPTSYGTRLLSPFDWHWYAFDWLPIIDVYLLAALAIGLVFGNISGAAVHRGATAGRRASDRRTAALIATRSRFATIVLVLMGINYGVRATTHHQALALAPELFGRLLPPACAQNLPLAQPELAVWPNARATAIDATVRPCVVELAAVPTFLSPFRWRVIARLSNSYELHDVDLLERPGQDEASAADRSWRLTLRYPDQWTAATTRAADAPMARMFLGFARFPAARTFTDRSGTTTVRWTDTRFAGGVGSLDDRSRRPNPFTLTVRLDASGHIVDQHTGER